MTFVSQQFLPKYSHSFVISPVLAWSVFVSFHLHFLRNFHTCQETDKSYSYANWIQSMASTQTKGSGSCISFIVYNSLQIVAKSEYSLMRQTWKFTSKWTWFVSIMLAWSFNKSRLFDYLAISVVQNERKVLWFWFWFRKAQFGEHYFRDIFCRRNFIPRQVGCRREVCQSCMRLTVCSYPIAGQSETRESQHLCLRCEF